jgi:hypothetical protein
MRLVEEKNALNKLRLGLGTLRNGDLVVLHKLCCWFALEVLCDRIINEYNDSSQLGVLSSEMVP